MQGNNLNNQDPVLPNSTVGTGNTPPLAISPTVSATFPNAQLDLNPNIQQPISDETPAPFTTPSQANTTPTPINQTSNISDTQVVGSVLSPASATDKPTGTSDDTVVTASPHVPKKYGGGKVIATIFGIMLIAGAVVAGVKLVQQRQLLEQEASSGSECQHADDCVLLDNAGNSGSFDAPGTIRYVDITDQDETRFNPGQVDDGCYRVNISGNHVSWEKYGPGPTCKDVSNVQIWHDDDDEPEISATTTPIITNTVTPNATMTLTPTQSATSCRVELDLPDTAVCWHEPKTNVPVGWTVISLPSTGGPYYLQTDWYVAEPNLGPHHYEKIGPVTVGQKGTIYADWPGVLPNQSEISENHYGLNVVDANGNPIFSNCSDGMDYYWTPYVCPLPTQPTSQVSAQCSAVTAYDTNWNILNAQTLSQLDPGKTIYLTVSGTSTSGSFDRARFTVNGVLRPETTNTKPGASNIFYDSYTIPAGATTFTVSAQVHHTSLGWF